MRLNAFNVLPTGQKGDNGATSLAFAHTPNEQKR